MRILHAVTETLLDAVLWVRERQGFHTVLFESPPGEPDIITTSVARDKFVVSVDRSISEEDLLSEL